MKRDMQDCEEALRGIEIHVAAGLPDQPAGNVTRAEGEPRAASAARTGSLDSLFNAQTGPLDDSFALRRG
jgi:hypothetical protein